MKTYFAMFQNLTNVNKVSLHTKVKKSLKKIACSMFSRLCTVYFLSEASCFLYLSIITENCRYWSSCFLQLLSSNKDHSFVPVHACSSFQLSLFVEVFVVCFWTKSFNVTPHSFSEFCSCKHQRECTVSTPHNFVDSRELHISLSIAILACHQLVTPLRLTPTKKPASQQKSIV